MKFFKNLNIADIKVLSFDLDNTIYDCQTVLINAQNWFTSYLCDKYGLGGECLSYDFWASIKKNLLLTEPLLEHDVTLLRARSLVEAFKIKNLPLKGGLDEALALVREFIKIRSRGIIHDEVRSLMASLQDKYPLVAVSNGNLDTDILGITSYFCYDLRPGMSPLVRCKPHPDLFEQCARLYGVKTCEILHIGDDPYTDVLGAVNAGCRCAWVYKGYTGISADEKSIRVLPDVLLHNVLELKELLL